MAPSRGLIHCTLAPHAPALLESRGATLIPSPFGRWMLERVASAMLDWSAVAFHRVELTPSGLELVLLAGSHAPIRPQCTAVAHALARELDVAARRGRWVRGALFTAVCVVVEATRHPADRGTT